MSFRLPTEESDEEERQPYSYWNNRQTATLTLATPTPYQRVGRTMNPFSRPPLRPGTGTTESASFHSLEPELEHKLIEPETETQLPDPETEFDLEPEPESEPKPKPTTVMANTVTTPPAMDVDHEGKSYLKKPTPFDGNQQKVDNFIYACDLFFEGSSDKDFPTDKQKIIFILSYMSEGEAQ